MITLGEDGLAKVKSGVTTPEELLRVVTEVREMRTLCSGLRRPRSASTSTPARSAASGSAAAARTAAGRCSPAGISVPYCARSTTEAKQRAEAAARRDETPRRPARAAGRQRRGVQEVGGAEELLRAARDRADAPADEMKKAFRAQIARYHPGQGPASRQGISEMAADRAAELTEAYRILSDEGRRAEYDRAFAETARRRRRRQPPPAPPAHAACRRRRRAAAADDAEPPSPTGAQFTAGAREPRRVRPQGDARAGCDRRSTRSAPATTRPSCRGFDIGAACRRASCSARSKNPRLLGALRRRASIATRSPTPGRRPAKWGDADATRCACCCWAPRWRRPASWRAAIADQRTEVARRQS